MTREERAKHWRTIIEKQAASGMSAAVFCREQNIKIQQFHWWRGRFKKEKSPTNGSGFLQLVPFCGTAHKQSGVHIHLRDGMSIEVEPGFDPSTLRGVMEAIKDLETKPCSH